jgi:hypothetical protein
MTVLSSTDRTAATGRRCQIRATNAARVVTALLDLRSASRNAEPDAGRTGITQHVTAQGLGR